MEIIPFYAPVFYEDSLDLNKKVLDKVALIDADRYKHVVTYNMYKKLMEEGERHTTALLNEIIDNYLSRDIFDCFEARAYIFCFSAPSSKVFRNAIAQEKKYKGNRKGDDPYHYTNKYEDMAYVYEYINSRYQTLFFDDLEADDILSMLQREETFVFSHDKDLKQVPGWHWDMDKRCLFKITEEEGFVSLLKQILTGDSTDNFGGLKGFGKGALEKFEEKIKVDSMKAEHIVYHIMKLYTDKHGILKGLDTFVEMWQLASMKLDRGEYFKDKYAKAFYLINKICNNGDTESIRDDENNGTVPMQFI